MFSMKSVTPEQERPFPGRAGAGRTGGATTAVSLSLWPGWGMAGAWLGHGWGRWAGGQERPFPGQVGQVGRNGRFPARWARWAGTAVS